MFSKAIRWNFLLLTPAMLGTALRFSSSAIAVEVQGNASTFQTQVAETKALARPATSALGQE